MGWPRGIVSAVLVVVACTDPRPAGPPKPPPLVVKRYAPLAFKADARAAHHAVLLGTDELGGSTILPLAPTPAPLVLEVFAPAKTTITLSANPMQTVSITGAEPTSSPAWRSTLVGSALVATTVLGKDLSDLVVSAAPSAPIASSSIAALAAVGVIAARAGTTPDPKVTLVGSLAPDGTLAPAPELASNVRAAVAAGKQRIGIPAGVMARSRNTPSPLADELDALARSGARLVELPDLAAAYRFVTGAQLPDTRPVSSADMQLDPTSSTAIDIKYKQWQHRLGVEWGAILQLESAGRLPQLLVFLRDSSKKLAQTAESLHQRGMLGAAYARMFAAALYAQTANQAYDILSMVQANRIDDAIALLAKHDALGDSTRSVLATIGERQPTTLGGHMQMLAAYRSALRGFVFETFASQAITQAKSELKTLAGMSTAELGSDRVAEKVVGMLVPTLLYVGKTLSETTLATEQLDIPVEHDVAFSITPDSVLQLATAYRTAGAASMAFVDVLVVHRHATNEKVSEEAARSRVAVLEPDYLIGHTLTRFDASAGPPRELASQWSETSLAWRLLVLAGTQLGHATASELVIKYDALGAEIVPDGSGRVSKVKHEATLASMLVASERAARMHARAALVATGFIPVQAKLAYQNALVDRKGSPSDQLDALTQFWAASAYAQTAVMLARN